MSISSPFPIFVSPSGGEASPFVSSKSTIQDLKSSLNVTMFTTLPVGYTISSANVIIDLWQKTTVYSSTTDVSWFFNDTICKFQIGATSAADVVYNNYVDGKSYKTLFQVSIADTNGAVTMYQCVYKFNYYSSAPTMSDFTFNQNIARNDEIYVSGLLLDPALTSISPFPNDTPTSLTFQFNELELVAGNINDEINEAYNPTLPYNSAGEYTLFSNLLKNDNFYQITATANWVSGYSTSTNSSRNLFVIARPEIDSIVTYDAQDDGGNDGVGDFSNGNDASTQTIATVTLKPAGYKNYLPTYVKIVFYNNSNIEIGSSRHNDYDATSLGTQSFSVKLGSVILNDSSVRLLNGLPGYTVKAQVTVPIMIDAVSYPDQIRTSDPKSAVFKQGVASILTLTIANTWDLVSDSNPSSAASLYNSSPVLGLSGYFLKNDQFASFYSKHLDKTSTKFLLQYKLNGGPLDNVVSAALLQQGTEALQQTMINAMSAVVSSPNGQYVNVVGPSGVVGSSQKPLVFYITNVQGSVTFKESDVVNVVVTVIDSSNQWLNSLNGDAVVSNTSSPVTIVNTVGGVIMVNKIQTYSYTSAQKGQTVEPSIEDVYSNSECLKALLDNQLVQVKRSDIIADSAANMITQTANGWNVVNPAAIGTPLKVPKVNFYYYIKGSGSSFTMNQVNNSTDLGMWYVINQNAGAKQYPFLIAYTQPTASGNKSSWYKSKILYSPIPSSDATQVGLTLLYTGTDNGSLYPEIPSARRVQLLASDIYSNKNADVSNELVSLVSVQTSSNVAEINTGDFNFLLRNTGIVTTSLFVGNYQLNFNDSSLMMTNNKMSLVNDDDTIIADSAQIITKSNKGWNVVNPAAIGTPPKVPKVNFYYYNMSASTSFTMSQVNQSSCLGMWYVIYQNPGAKLYPFLIAYTKPTGSGDARSWYKSNVLYGPDPSSTATRSGFTLLYTGTDNGSFYPEIPSDRRVKLLLSPTYSTPSTLNPDLPNETIKMLSVHTSSNTSEVNTGDFNFSLVYAGVVTTVSGSSNINTFFANPLLKLNVPLNNGNSVYFNDATVNSLNTPSRSVVVKSVASASYDQSVAEQPLSPPVNEWSLGIVTLPVLTQNLYNVQYSIQNPNKNNAVVKGLVSATSTVSTLNEPQLTDFTVANFSFNTINNNTKSSIVFDLTLNPYVLDRIDGVHVYFTSDSKSSIPLTKIGTFKTNQTGREIFLLSNDNSNLLGSGSYPHQYNDPLVNSQLLWNPYTSATITFVPFRDNRVNSAVVETENLFATFTAPVSVWNIPVIDKPSVSGDIILTGGVVNSETNTVLKWVNDTGSAYSYPVAFTYTLTMAKDSASANGVQYTTLAGAASAILAIATSETNAYQLTLKKVFQGQSSLADTVTFNSAKVNTDVMNVTVSNPSNNSNVTASWVAPAITGTSSSFANNVVSLYLSDNGTSMKSVTDSTIEESGGSYSITKSMGSSYQLGMKVTACVPYSVNSGVSVKSLAVPLRLGPFTPYTVSTIPHVSLSSATSTVLIQGSSNPSLLLNLNAMGLEDEGFISLVVVLTQDGTDIKPEGCEVLLQFPSPVNPSYLNNLGPSNPNINQFLFPNIVGALGSGNDNLVGGESSTVAPLNKVPTGLSNNVGNYTLSIGSVNTSGANIGRYSLSSLTFPSSSGFVNGETANIMAILTHRRGTDVMVGEFTYSVPPVASEVSVSNVHGSYFVNFMLS